MTRFVSYSSDLRVTALVETLRRHGLATWRDQEALGAGQATRAEIEAELAGCDAAMLWLGGGTLRSQYVCRVEIPLIVDAYEQRSMRVVPLFVDVGAREGIDAVRDATGQEIGDHNGLVMADDENLPVFLDRVAEEEVRTHLRARATGRRPVVRVVTRSDVAGGLDVADLNFDWIREYPSDGELPGGDTAAALRRTLHRSVQELLAAFGAGSVDLHLACHLHLGVAVGFELRRVTQAVPRVAVGDHWWTCGPASARTAAPLAELVTQGPVDGTRSAVELNLSRDISATVSAHVASTGTNYRERIRLRPPDGPAQESVSPASCNAWAEQAADVIRRTRARPGVDGVDLFLAAPMGFAVALGWRLNAVGGVRLFHPEGNAGPYRHVWTLPSS